MQTEGDGGHAVGRNVVVAETPLFLSGNIDRGDIGRLTPSFGERVVISAVGVEVDVVLVGIADAVAVAVGERLEASTVAVWLPCGGVVIARLAVFNVEPDILDRHVRADDDLIARASDRIIGLGRPEDTAGRRLGIVVKDLRERLVERRGSVGVAVEMGSRTKDVEALAQSGLRGKRPIRISHVESRFARVIVVREERDGGRVEIGHAEGGQHVFLAGNFARSARPHRRRTGFVETDLVAEHGSRGGFGDVGRTPPIITCLAVTVIQLGHARGAATDTSGTFGERAVDRVVDEGLEAAADRIALGPNDDVAPGLVELLGRICDTADVVLRIVIDPCGSIATVISLGDVGVCWSVVDRPAAPDSANVGLCTGRTDLAAFRVFGREFFRVLALDEQRLLVTHPNVAEDSRGMVAEGGVGVAGGACAVQIDAAIESEPDVFGRAVGARHDGKIAGPDHRDSRLVAVGRGRDAGRIAAVGQTVRVEIDVAVGTVATRHRDAGNFLQLSGSGVGLVKRDGRLRPEVGQFGRAPSEEVVAAGRNDDGAEFPRIFVEAAHERTVRSLGVLIEVSTRREAGRDGARLALRSVVVEHRHHGDFLGGRAVALVAESVAVVAALIGHVIAVGPTPLLETAGEVVVQLQDVGNARIAELTEEMRVGVARKGTAGFAERAGFVIAVRVNKPYALAEHVVRVLHFLHRGKIAVVAVGVRHADARGETTGAGSVQAGQSSAGIAQVVVQHAAQIVVDQTHAGVDVAAVAGRLSEVLAENHGVVAAALLVEDGIAVVGVAETAGEVELALDAAEIPGIAVVFVFAGHLAEKVVRHVLHRIEAEAIGLGAVDFPAGGPDEVSADVFDVSAAVGENVSLGMLAQRFLRGVGTQRGAGLINQPSEVDRIAVFIAVVLLGTVEVADEGIFRMRGTLRATEVSVRRFMGEVDQVRKPEVQHLPAVLPIPRIVPLAVKTILGDTKMKILRHNAGIKFLLPLAAGRRGFVEPRDVERPVVHDVVEIHADPEAVRHLHHVLQIGLGAVARAHRVALVFLPEIERIPEIIADREAARAFGRRRQPERTVTRLDQFGHLAGDFRVRNVEELQQPFGTGSRKLAPGKEEAANRGDQQTPPKCRGEHHLGTSKCPRFFSDVKVGGHRFTE